MKRTKACAPCIAFAQPIIRKLSNYGEREMSVTRAAAAQSFGPVRRCVLAGDPRGALEGAEPIEACKTRET